jgi:predicted deacylase
MRDAVHIQAHEVAPGRTSRIELPVARLPIHTMLHLPLTVVNGVDDGPRLWLSAALHGDEVNGMEIVRRVLERLERERLAGMLLAAPIVNVFGFVNQSRYLPDRRDLNRAFPGSRRGSLASRLAHLFMTEVVARCTHGLDLHTAAPPRANLPQLRGDLSHPETRRCAEAFGAPVMVHATAPKGTLRGAARRRGTAVLLYEAGEPFRLDEAAATCGVDGVLRVMAALGMIAPELAPPPQPSLEVTDRRWVRASQSGVLYRRVALGEQVERGQLLATVSDPFGETVKQVRSPIEGIVIGLCIHALVHRGDAVVHVAG